MKEMALESIGLKVSEYEMAWIEKRLAEGRHIDVGDYFRDLIRRDLDGLLPQRRTLRQ